MEIQSRYVNPFERNYTSYNEHLIAFNRCFQKEIESDLNSKISDNRISIVTTGSDGRLEKGPISPIEVIILSEEGNFDLTVNELKNYICKSNKKKVFNTHLEKKDLSKDEMYKCIAIDENSNKVEFNSPNRMFDMSFLFGDKSLVTKSLENFYCELNSQKGKSILKLLKDRQKEHANISLSGVQNFKGNHLTHYILDEGVAFYNPSLNIWSFKQGPLRTLQYSLIRDLVKKLRTDYISPERIFNLPRNVVEKLNCLEVEGLSQLSSLQIDELADSYKYLLHLYHKSQFAYSHLNSEKITFNSQEVKERCNSIVRICSLQLIH